MKIFFILLGIAVGNIGLASCKVDIEKYVGWSIIFKGTVTGYLDENGEKKNEFSGCEYGRKLIIDYTRVVTCQTYNYQYAYNPDIVILKKSSMMKACIDNEIYDID